MVTKDHHDLNIFPKSFRLFLFLLSRSKIENVFPVFLFILSYDLAFEAKNNKAKLSSKIFSYLLRVHTFILY